MRGNKSYLTCSIYMICRCSNCCGKKGKFHLIVKTIFMSKQLVLRLSTHAYAVTIALQGNYKNTSQMLPFNPNAKHKMTCADICKHIFYAL